MSTHANPQNPRQTLLLQICLVLLVPLSAWAIFSLPWHVPVKGPVVSESYTFGFSNITAHLSLAALLAGLLILRLLRPDARATDCSLASSLIGTPARPCMPLRLASLISIILATAVVGGCWKFLPYAYFGESIYFLPRLDRMLAGQMPFRDFDYGYGPLMLYLPLFLHKAGRGLLAIDTAYIASVVLFYTAGVFALDYMARCLRISNICRAVLILSLGLATLNISLGIIYTPLRFIFPLWSVIFLHNKMPESTPLKQGFLALLLALTGLGICPETGLVTCLALLTGFFRRWHAGLRLPVAACLGVAASCLLILFLFGWNYFKLVFLFGGGAFNFPISPAPNILVFIIAAAWLLPRIATGAATQPGPGGPLFASLLIATGLFLPAALGRCDPGHVLFNGLPLLFLMAGTAFHENHLLPKVTSVLAALLLFATTGISARNFDTFQIKEAVDQRHKLAAQGTRLRQSDALVKAALAGRPELRLYAWGKQFPFEADLLELLHYHSIATPINATEDIDRFLKLSGRYIPSYFVAPGGGGFTPQTVGQQLADMHKAEAVLIPDYALKFLQPTDNNTYAKWMSARYMTPLFVFPVQWTVVHPPYFPQATIMQVLNREYAVTGKFRDYLIYQHKPASQEQPAR